MSDMTTIPDSTRDSRRAENRHRQWLSGLSDALLRADVDTVAAVAELLGEPLTANAYDAKILAKMNSQTPPDDRRR